MAKNSKNRLALMLALAMVASLARLSAQDLKSAIQLTESEQYNEAWSIYQQLITSEPANGDLYFYYGESYLKSYFADSAGVDLNEMAAKAKDIFQKGINAKPSNPLNYTGMGKVELYTGNPGKAKEYFDKAIELLPTKKNKIIMPVERHAATYQKIADAYLKAPSKDTANVFPYLRLAEKINKKDPETYLIRGDAYLFIINDGSNAILNYKKSQDLNPQSSRAKLRLGQLWVRAKRYMDALDYYNEAINIDSSFTPAYRERAELYAMAGQYDNAKANYKKFLELSKDNLYAKVRYASFLFLTKSYKETIDQANNVMAIDQSYNFLNRLVAYSYYETAQYEPALKSIEAFFANTVSQKIIPSDYAYYGKILAKLGKDSLAVEKLNQAWKRDTTNLDLLEDMVRSLNKLKKFDEVVKIYQYKLNTGQGGIQDRYNLGKAYYNLAAWGKADTALSMVIEAKPEYIQAYAWKARVYSNLDPETKEGLAKPHYELLIEKASVDSVKNSKELIEAYSYLGYYYFKNKKYCESLDYWHKVEAIDPNSEKAKSAIKDLKTRCPGK